MCSVRGHLKWSLLKFTPQVSSQNGKCVQILSFRLNLIKFPPFETVIAGRSSIYVFNESPFKTVSRIRSLLKFTHQVTSITFKFTATVTFKFTAQVYPPNLKLSLLVDQVSLCSVRAHLKHLAELGHCSSLLLKLPASPSSVLPESPSSLPPPQNCQTVKFTPFQSSRELLEITTPKKSNI